MKRKEIIRIIADCYTPEEVVDRLAWYLTGEDTANLKTLFRQEVDPQAAVKQFTDALTKLVNKLHKKHGFYNEELLLVEQLSDSLSEVGTQGEVGTQADKWHQEFDANLTAQLGYIGYSQQEFQQDVRGEEPPMFYTEQQQATSRLDWRRVTASTAPDVRMVINFGNFSLDTTDAYHKALLRVRTSIRRGEPCLNVGGVEINFAQKQIQCLVYGCKHRGYLPDTDDREFQEFVVMRILYHLGNHQQNAKTSNLFPKFLAEPKRYRDTDVDRWQSRGVALGKFPALAEQ